MKTRAVSAQCKSDVPEESCGVRQFKDDVTSAAFNPEAGAVQAAGDFNDWQPLKSRMIKFRKSGVWKIILSLIPAACQYRFVVDDCWWQDSCSIASEPSAYGELNPIIRVI